MIVKGAVDASATRCREGATALVLVLDAKRVTWRNVCASPLRKGGSFYVAAQIEEFQGTG